jgi:hypothetical protein
MQPDVHCCMSHWRRQLACRPSPQPAQKHSKGRVLTLSVPLKERHLRRRDMNNQRLIPNVRVSAQNRPHYAVHTGGCKLRPCSMTRTCMLVYSCQSPTTASGSVAILLARAIAAGRGFGSTGLLDLAARRASTDRNSPTACGSTYLRRFDAFRHLNTAVTLCPGKLFGKAL